MPTHSDYLPQKEDDLVDWAVNFTGQIGQHFAEWQIPQQELAAVTAALTAYQGLHAQANSPERNAIIVAEKNAARDALKELIRAMVNYRFAAPFITDAIRVQCGLHSRDHVRTSQGTPGTRPEFDLRDKDFRRLAIDFWDQGSGSRARPYGMSGAVISWLVSDTPPSGPEAMTQSVLATHTPFTLEFTESERSHTVHIVLQWQNTTGKKGPFSEIQSAIVP